MMKKITIKFLYFFLITSLFLILGCNKQSKNENEIIIGTTVGDFSDMLKKSIKPILESKGYKIKIIEFTDYVQPNLSLENKNIDINIFQDIPYLESFQKSHPDTKNIITIFEVPTAPFGIYSGKLQSINQLTNNNTISIPNDPSNQAKALSLLESLGLIKLDPSINKLVATTKDIIANKHNIKFIELEAAQLPRSRNDVDLATINGNYAMDAGIDLTTALAIDKGYTYINYGAILEENKDKKWVKDLINAYNSEEFKNYIYKTYKGYKYPKAWDK